jgi:hypothetical protein
MQTLAFSAVAVLCKKRGRFASALAPEQDMIGHKFVSRGGWMAVFSWFSVAGAVAADRIELRESPTETRVFAVAARLDVAGRLFPQPGEKNALKLVVAGQFGYSEKRLPGTGRDAEAIRAVRRYDEAKVRIDVGDQYSGRLLRETARLIVANGRRDGIQVFSPSVPLTPDEVDLLRLPGDNLCALILLPESAVEPGDTWKVPDWGIQMLTSLEALEKGSIECRLASLKDQVARIEVAGEATGAVLGASAGIKVEGHVLFDVEQKCIQRVELTQSEKRDVGTVSPGLDVAAKVVLTRTVVDQPKHLTDKEIAELPLEPNPATLLLMFDAPDWGVRMYPERSWHLFHKTTTVAVLRLLEKGSLIAQCNVRRLEPAEAGKHLSEEQFQADIERSLGKGFRQFVQSEKIENREGLHVLRVVASGGAERKTAKNEIESIPMQWIYYLVAHPDGRQMAFVFTVEPERLEILKSRDMSLVSSLEFLPAKARVSGAPGAARQ